MNRNTTNIILRFAIVMMLLATVLFFIVDAASPAFIAICLTMFFCTLVVVFGTVQMHYYEENQLSKRALIIALCVWLGVVAVCVVVKVIIAAV